MSNEFDKAMKEAVRQVVPLAQGSTVMAGSAGTTSQPATATSTRVDSEGKVRRLFLLDHDTLDDPTKYLGSDPLPEE